MKEADCKFYWVGEETEKFVARDLASLNEYCGYTGTEDELNEENKGSEWGDDIDPDEETVTDADEIDGPERTLREAFREWYLDKDWFQKSGCAQISTSYN